MKFSTLLALASSIAMASAAPQVVPTSVDSPDKAKRPESQVAERMKAGDQKIAELQQRLDQIRATAANAEEDEIGKAETTHLEEIKRLEEQLRAADRAERAERANLYYLFQQLYYPESESPKKDLGQRIAKVLTELKPVENKAAEIRHRLDKARAAAKEAGEVDIAMLNELKGLDMKVERGTDLYVLINHERLTLLKKLEDAGRELEDAKNQTFKDEATIEALTEDVKYWKKQFQPVSSLFHRINNVIQDHIGRRKEIHAMLSEKSRLEVELNQVLYSRAALTMEHKMLFRLFNNNEEQDLDERTEEIVKERIPDVGKRLMAMEEKIAEIRQRLVEIPDGADKAEGSREVKVEELNELERLEEELYVADRAESKLSSELYKLFLHLYFPDSPVTKESQPMTKNELRAKIVEVLVELKPAEQKTAEIRGRLDEARAATEESGEDGAEEEGNTEMEELSRLEGELEAVGNLYHLMKSYVREISSQSNGSPPPGTMVEVDRQETYVQGELSKLVRRIRAVRNGMGYSEVKQVKHELDLAVYSRDELTYEHKMLLQMIHDPAENTEPLDEQMKKVVDERINELSDRMELAKQKVSEIHHRLHEAQAAAEEGKKKPTKEATKDAKEDEAAKEATKDAEEGEAAKEATKNAEKDAVAEDGVRVEVSAELKSAGFLGKYSYATPSVDVIEK